MRFFANGPNIPDELLAARDEGQVIFFCGSGVSRARTGLPDFYGLAMDVVEKLGAAKKSRARAVIDAAQRVGQIDGVGGLVPADRVFSLLEQEFDVGLVRSAVAEALRPKNVDYSAHRALIDLSKGTDGLSRLITTNFDPLFELSDRHQASHGPPDLPDPNRPHRFNGIIHLHGRVGFEYVAPQDEEFVLSSADFGRAYLSDGWATRFIRSLLNRYQLVFVGYAADDPPVQYLLEALGRPGLLPNNIYAFQSGSEEHARALWAHRGVEAIAYDPADGHCALWDTVIAWAERAQDPDAWLRSIIDLAKTLPGKLSPIDRGKVAHLTMSSSGAKLLARAGAEVSSEWLCVFDPNIRYASPEREGYETDSPYFDPFENWGLDQDDPPAQIDPEAVSKKREIPEGAWNAFRVTHRDRSEVEAQAPPYFFGNDTEQVGPLPPRLSLLGDWVASVSHEPGAVWWAAGMRAFHVAIRRKIDRAIGDGETRSDRVVRNGWRLLLDERQQKKPDHPSFGFYRLNDQVKQDGWSRERLCTLANLRRPAISVLRPYGVSRPPSTADRTSALVRVDIEYPHADVTFDIPNELLATYVRQLGVVIDFAVAMELRHHRSIFNLGPFTRPELEEGEDSSPPGDLTGLLLDWIDAIDRLRQLDREGAIREVQGWFHRPEAPFVRLRLWAVGQPDILSADDAANALLQLDSNAFWELDHQRDLLHVLKARWDEFTPEIRGRLETLILEGPPPQEFEESSEHEQRAAWQILQRLQWLADQRCKLTIDLEAETIRLTKIQPRWSPEVAKAADESHEMRAYSITQDSDPSPLLQVPLSEVLDVAMQLHGQRRGERVEAAPFTGLAETRPARALAALRRNRDAPAKWAWDAFLYSGARSSDSARVSCAIGTLISRMNIEELAPIIRSATSWFTQATEEKPQLPRDLADQLWDRLLLALEAKPDLATSAVLGTPANRDWIFEAINSASGKLAQLVVQSIKPDDHTGLQRATSLTRLKRLILLPDQVGLYSLALAVRNISYLFTQDRDWAEQFILPARRGTDMQRDAFWSGVFRSRGLTTDLAILLRDDIVALATDQRSGRIWNQPLANFLLGMWSRQDLRERGAALNDSQLRDALVEGSEDLRLQVLRTTQSLMQNPEAQSRDRAADLVESVWPRQNSARSQPVTTAIIRLVIGSGDLFPRMVEVTRDLVAPISREAQWSVDMESARPLATDHPDAMLAFLYTILPEDAQGWPYRSEALVEILAENAKGPDPRLQELRRRLAAR